MIGLIMDYGHRVDPSDGLHQEAVELALITTLAFAFVSLLPFGLRIMFRFLRLSPLWAIRLALVNAAIVACLILLIVAANQQNGHEAVLAIKDVVKYYTITVIILVLFSLIFQLSVVFSEDHSYFMALLSYMADLYSLVFILSFCFFEFVIFPMYLTGNRIEIN